MEKRTAIYSVKHSIHTVHMYVVVYALVYTIAVLI